MFDKIDNTTKPVLAPVEVPTRITQGLHDNIFPTPAVLGAFEKSPQDPEFANIQVDYIQLGPGAAYSPYLDDQDLVFNVNNQIEIAKHNDDIASLRAILQTYKPLNQSVQARREKIDKCISALNDTKIAKAKLKSTPAADLTDEDLDQWQNWNDLESTCNSLLMAHVANQANRESINMERMRGGEGRFNRKRPRATQQLGEQEQGADDEQSEEEIIMPIPETQKKNPNEGRIISAVDWEKMLSSAWTHKGFSGENKRNQGLVLYPPNTIFCKICNKSNIQYKRLSQHISGQKHQDLLPKFRKEQTKKESLETRTGINGNSVADEIDREDIKKATSEGEKACKAEVIRLHQFLVNWRTGAIAKNENTFKLLSEVLSSDFQVVSADGDIIGRTDLLQEIIKSYNTYEKGDLTVDINNFRLIRSGKTCLMTYKEWQRIESTTTARIATVVFRRLKESRLEWVHVHETWVPGTNLRSEGATFGD